ncbi:hypothetical protein [Cesiribacter andamanensis]|uniref:Lipocalin-like domain-containing protein n=1 Tax=Cesiribacter andamanensis AMV16 TaxID=1279009 RepID=M7N0S8_9BACT|nr:hypothetical protein [Cesiribacter andamanensis]EMR00806.1 hypothetical protein ADICEAN_04065 [Cesiribacter andamanensis AMV16]
MNTIKSLAVITLVMVLAVFTACKKEDPETDQQRNTRLISKTWRVNTVTLDPQEDYSLSGETVTVTFNSNGSYTINTPAALPKMRTPNEAIPASGSWQFVGSAYDRVRLTSGSTTLELAITSLTDNALTVTYPGAEPKATDEVTVTVNMVPNS